MSGGYLYGNPEPIEACPYCKAECRADYCDIGVGYQQVGPFHCAACGASEISPYDRDRDLTADEKRTGWYAPGAEPGSSANVINGKIVDYKTMQAAYHREFSGNPLYEEPGAVEDWFRKVRKPSGSGM